MTFKWVAKTEKNDAATASIRVPKTDVILFVYKVYNTVNCFTKLLYTIKSVFQDRLYQMLVWLYLMETSFHASANSRTQWAWMSGTEKNSKKSESSIFSTLFNLILNCIYFHNYLVLYIYFFLPFLYHIL